jgi:hypothetical protein
LVKIYDLFRGEWAVGRITGNVGEILDPGSKGVVFCPLLGILHEMVVHESWVIGDVPIDTVCGRILEVLVGHISKALKTPGTILDHAEEEDVARGSGALTTDLKVVRVPSLRPLLCVLIDTVEEEVMQKPDVCGNRRVEAMVDLKIEEELLPLEAKAMSDIVPQPLYPSVVDAPGMPRISIESIGTGEETHLPHMYEPRSTPRSSSIIMATRTFSVPWSPRTRLGRP